MAQQPPSSKPRKKGPKLTKDGKITVFDAEDVTYGIRELIDLIRYIPEGQDVFFGAEMIKKTLGSMQISIHDIMQDGVEKRKLASKTIQHLVAEIADYQRRVQSLKGHIRHLRYELGEIQDTAHYLLADDSELSQYQHILDEVVRSPIEGDDEHHPHSTPFKIENTIQELDDGDSDDGDGGDGDGDGDDDDDSDKIISEDFTPNETLIGDEASEEDSSFVPDALTNPDEEYTQTNEQALSSLTDEVFNPDRFDDKNGVDTHDDPFIDTTDTDNELISPEIDPFSDELTPASEDGAEDDFTQRL